MAKSTFLGIERITNLESAQGLKAINAAISQLERSVNAQLKIRDIGNADVTLTEEDVTSHGVIILSGATDNFTVNVPATLNTNAIERSYIIKNNNPGFIATVTSGVGVSTNIPGSGTSYIFQDNDGINPVNDPQSSGGGGGGGSGDVTGPASATANGIALYSGTSGKVIKSSVVSVDSSGNITAANINGRDIAVDGAKLDGIESGATADQTGPEIKTLYEAEADTNPFNNAYKAKIDGIESNATADQTDSEIEIAYNNQVPRISTTEITQGTETSVRTVSPKDVKDIVDAHAPSGGGGSGDLSGPASSTTNAVAVYSDGTGDTVKNTTVTIDSSGNIATPGTVNGRDVAADGSKLDTVASGATGDQTGVEIKALYEAQSNTNNYSDAEKTKLASVSANASDDQTGAEIKTLYEGEPNTNAFTDPLKSKLESIDAAHYGSPLETTAELVALSEANITDKERRYVEGELSDYFYDVTAGSGDLAPTDQTGGTGFWRKVSAGGETATSVKTKYESNANTNVFDDDAQTKLAGIEDNATADQSDAEIKTSYENNADTNVFDDAAQAKLAGIEANATADQTDAEIKTAYENNANTNAYTDADAAKLAIIEAGATADQTGAEIKTLYEAEANTNAFEDADRTKLDGIESGATSDQTGAEIKTAYEAEADTNAYTDADQAKVAGMETNATADQTGAEIKTLYEAETNTNAYTDADQAKVSGVESGATADQTDAEIEIAYNNQVSQVSAGEITAGTETTVRRFSPEDVAAIATAHGGGGGGGSMTDSEVKTAYENNANTNAYTDADQAKVAGIEANATADQTGAEIKALYEGEPNSNQYSDGEKTKLGNIESNATADQTDAEIKTAYENNANTNAYTDGEKSKLAAIESGATADQTGAEIKTSLFSEADTNNLDDALLAKLNGIEAGASTETYSTIITKLSGAPITPVTPDAADKVLIQDAGSGNLLRIITVQSIVDLLSTSLSGSDIESGYNSEVPQVTAAEITAGTETDVRRLSPEDVTSFINQHASSNAMTGPQIKTALFAESDTNNLNDILKAKLDNLDENATPTNTANVLAALELPVLPTEAPASNDGILFRDISDGNEIKLASPVQIAAFANSSLTGAQVTTALDGHSLAGVTVASTDKILIQDLSDADKIKVVSAQAIADLASVNITDAEIETGYNNQVPQVTAGEITTAQETNVRRFSPADIADIATTHVAGASLTDSQVETAYNNQVSQVSAGEITAGTETNVRRYSPADVAALIAAHGGGSGGGGGGAPDVVLTAQTSTDLIAGGTSYVVDWAVHGMSVFLRNELGLTLSGGGVGGLTPGTYWVEGRAPFFRVNNALLRLNFNEGGETFVYGTPCYSNANANGYGDQVMAFVEGEFTVTSSATLKMDYRTSYSSGTNDKGKPGSWGEGPVSRQTMKIWKV